MEIDMFNFLKHSDHEDHSKNNNDFNWDLDVSYDFASEINMDFDTNADYSSDICVDANIDVCVDIDGNLATFNVDVQAVGEDSATEVNIAVITTDDYSSITLSGYSAVT